MECTLASMLRSGGALSQYEISLKPDGGKLSIIPSRKGRGCLGFVKKKLPTDQCHAIYFGLKDEKYDLSRLGTAWVFSFSPVFSRPFDK